MDALRYWTQIDLLSSVPPLGLWPLEDPWGFIGGPWVVSKKRKPLISGLKSTVTGTCTPLGDVSQCANQKGCTPRALQHRSGRKRSGCRIRHVAHVRAPVYVYVLSSVPHWSSKDVVCFVLFCFLNLALMSFVTPRICYCSKEMMLFFVLWEVNVK